MGRRPRGSSDSGANALAEKRHSVALEFLSHFWAPIPWMIEAAVVLTAVTARWLLGFSERHRQDSSAHSPGGQ